MNLYTVAYTTSNYSDTTKTAQIVAPSVLKAVQEVMKKKYVSYSGEVKGVSEAVRSVNIAK